MNDKTFIVDSYKGHPVVAFPDLYQSENVTEVSPAKEDKDMEDIELIDEYSPEDEVYYSFFQHTSMIALYSLDMLISELDDETRYTADGVDRKDSLKHAMNTIHEMVYGVGVD